MSTHDATGQGEEGEQAGWTDDLPIGSRAASNLADEYGNEDELVEAYRQAEDITEVSYVGTATMRELRELIHDRDPEAERVRYENDDDICTEFTTDHGIEGPEEDAFYFAFVCPRCGSKNPLQGDPSGFKNKPFACTSCRWVPLLEAGALERFVEEAEE